MIEITESEMVAKATWLNSIGKPWHFHLLTPDCVFNKNGGFVLVLETPVEKVPYINFSDIKQESTAKLLLELLHGIKADSDIEVGGNVSEAVRNMEKRAKELTNNGILWHHHAFFPDCTYNDQKGKWKIVLEDPETKNVMESVTDQKPDEDLKVIEPLFYHQKK